MKNIIIIFAVVIFCTNTIAQIILEQTYDSASTYGVKDTINGSSPASQLMIIDFEISGECYVNINKVGRCISIFDLNHILIKKISYSGLPQSNGPAILYLSQQLFNTDSAIEFMYIYLTGSPPISHTNIYNEGLNLLFSIDCYSPLISISVPQQQRSIYNTINGTKMILSSCDTDNGQAKVFSLPGTLSTAIAEANGQLMQEQSGQGQFSNLYPNPSNGAVTLQYELPKGEQYGEIVLHDVQGNEVKRYKVDNTFNDILLDNTMLPAGTYFYQLQTAKEKIGVKKMIVIK